MLIEIYMAESTILRTEKLAKKGEDKVQEQIAIKIILVSSSRYRYSKGKESVISFVKQRMMWV
jgi:hypothetical protein